MNYKKAGDYVNEFYLKPFDLTEALFKKMAKKEDFRKNVVKSFEFYNKVILGIKIPEEEYKKLQNCMDS